MLLFFFSFIFYFLFFLIPDEEQVCFQARVSAGGRGVQRGSQLPAEPEAMASRGRIEGQRDSHTALPATPGTDGGAQALGAVLGVNTPELRAAL